jgi:deoxyribonuclease V
LSEAEAAALQQRLAAKVVKRDQLPKIKKVAGVDVAYDSHSERLCAAVVILDAGSLEPVETAVAEVTTSFPYLPGLFSFRELPSILKAFKRLSFPPDLVVCDGHGIAHPRRFGLASHLGVLLDVPTIGCGKTLLIGEAEEPGNHRGAWSPLIDQGEVIGCVLRTQNHVKPVYVSIGHRISLPTAREWILKLSPRFRLPETTRLADRIVRRALGQV